MVVQQNMGILKSPIKKLLSVNQKTPYAIAKFSCSKYLMELFKKNKFPVTIFRLFQVYGPKQDENRIIPYLIKKLLKE